MANLTLDIMNHFAKNGTLVSIRTIELKTQNGVDVYVGIETQNGADLNPDYLENFLNVTLVKTNRKMGKIERWRYHYLAKNTVEIYGGVATTDYKYMYNLIVTIGG